MTSEVSDSAKEPLDNEVVTSEESNVDANEVKESNEEINLPDSSKNADTVNDPSVTNNINEESSKDSEKLPNESLDTESRLLQLEKEHETLNTQYMRIAADFDNFRKRQTRDNDDLRIQLKCNTLTEILPVIDNFERARQQLNPQGEEAQALHRSYQGLYKQFVEVLKNLGVAPMRVVGQSFDPNLHEAVMREPSEEKAEDIIIEELQRGYHLSGRVLRHALVKVSMGPGPKDDNANNSSEEVSIDESESENIPDDYLQENEH